MNIMKTFVIFLFLVGFVFSAEAQLVTNKTARFKTKVVLNEAKSIGGAVMTSISPSPETTSIGVENKNVGTNTGREYELAWKFIGRKGDKDVYEFTFTRMTKAGVLSKTGSSKEVDFDGKRAVVFEDELHAVIVESPSSEDLKDAVRKYPN